MPIFIFLLECWKIVEQLTSSKQRQWTRATWQTERPLKFHSGCWFLREFCTHNCSHEFKGKMSHFSYEYNWERECDSLSFCSLPNFQSFSFYLNNIHLYLTNMASVTIWIHSLIFDSSLLPVLLKCLTILLRREKKKKA